MAVLLGVVAYWGLALACGFALGALRELIFTPRFGPVIGTALELPIILALLWIGSGWIVRRLGLASTRQRTFMGALWFVAFLVTEFALGGLLRGWSPAETVAHFTTVQGGLGLAGFVLAASFQVLHRGPGAIGAQKN